MPCPKPSPIKFTLFVRPRSVISKQSARVEAALLDTERQRSRSGAETLFHQRSLQLLTDLVVNLVAVPAHRAKGDCSGQHINAKG